MLGFVPSNTCERRVGRLIEIAVDGGYHSPADVDTMTSMIGACIVAVPAHAHAVIAADWRGVHLMSPETAARAHAMLLRHSPRVERSAILVHSASGTEMLQFVRLVRESHHPGRRIFDHVEPMRAWLAEILMPHENERLTSFLHRLAP